MAKYVCDFDQVNSSAKKILSESESMIGFTNAMVLTSANALSNWSGSTHDNFIGSLERKKTDLVNHINLSIQLSEFLKNTADAISMLEDELSSLDI